MALTGSKSLEELRDELRPVYTAWRLGAAIEFSLEIRHTTKRRWEVLRSWERVSAMYPSATHVSFFRIRTLFEGGIVHALVAAKQIRSLGIQYRVVDTGEKMREKNLLPGVSPVQSQEELEVIRTAWVLGVPIEHNVNVFNGGAPQGWALLNDYEGYLVELADSDDKDWDYWINYATGYQRKTASLDSVDIRILNQKRFRIAPMEGAENE